jgi:hypothetical protein
MLHWSREKGEVQTDESDRVAELERLVGRLTMEARDRKKSISEFDFSCEQKRKVAEKLIESYPVRLVCTVLGLAVSSLYYTRREREEATLVQAVEEIAAHYPRYGSRRISKQLAREPYFMRVGRKRVQRIMRERGLVVLIKRSKKRTTNSNHSFTRFPNLVLGLKVTRPDEVWVCDITYIRLGGSEFVYLAIVMDVFTRLIRGWNLSRSLAVEISVLALEQALSKAVCEIHHSDQGVQYACPVYVPQVESKRDSNQHGRGWRIKSKRFCRTSDSYNQGRRGLLE